MKVKEKYRKPVMTAAGVAKLRTLNVTCVILTHHMFGTYGVTLRLLGTIRKYIQVVYLNTLRFVFHSMKVKEKYRKPVMTAAGVASCKP